MSVIVRLDASPFSEQSAFAVEDEGAALDAAHRFAVEFFP